MKEAEYFKGRKGKKRMEALEVQLNRVTEEYENRYMHIREMKYIEENVKWRKTSKLVFYMGQKLVYFRWKGLRDYGFIRMAAQWLEANRISEPSPEDVVNMMEELLPGELFKKLQEDLAQIEFLQELLQED